MEPADPGHPLVPPDDPEEWTDEEWLVWLEATDAEARAEDRTRPVTRSARVVRSAGGQVLGQAMLGMAIGIYGKRDEIAIVAEAPSGPGEDEPFQVTLDPDHPERSSVVIRADGDPPGDLQA
jgi:hypothetical protein